jgi:hypothetical protein
MRFWPILRTIPSRTIIAGVGVALWARLMATS